MRRLWILLVAWGCLAVMAEAQKPVLRTGKNNLEMILDGKRIDGGWHVMPEINPDILETSAQEVIFASDIDTLVVDYLKEWESMEFDIIKTDGAVAHVRIDRTSANPFENPNPKLLEISPSGLLSKEQAQFDIDALIYTLSQVHPDIFSICRQEDLLRAVNRAKAQLPDSVSKMQLYQAAAPLVAMIGDGHTNLVFPFNSVFNSELLRMPVYVNVLPDRTLKCTSSLDSIIPRGAKILSINNVDADSIIQAMMPYVSGERPHFKLSRINTSFTALHQMLFPAEKYTVRYTLPDSREILTHTFPAVKWDEIKKRCPSTRKKRKNYNYAYEIYPEKNVAVMDFLSFKDYSRMEHFADSMFRDLKEKKIGNLIIDIRNNGGGASSVGDIILRYISPEPFVQMDKALVRVTPLTAKLMNNPDIRPMLTFYDSDTSEYINPRTAEEGHYDGNVYLLTSNRTFSSAGSFSWAFKECSMGTVIGEETGGMNVCYGDILMYKLPVSGLSTSISFKRFWQLRADENDIHGTIPDIAVPAEQALDKAFEIIRN